MGGFEAPALAGAEPTVKYHPYYFGILTSPCYPGKGQWQAGSLTGAVASMVGRPDGNIRGKSGCMLGGPEYHRLLGSLILISSENTGVRTISREVLKEPLND